MNQKELELFWAAAANQVLLLIDSSPNWLIGTLSCNESGDFTGGTQGHHVPRSRSETVESLPSWYSICV